MIEIRNLDFSYKGEYILKGINLDINKEDYMIISGVNGSGKSTLVKCILGINKVKSKMISINGIDINKYEDFTNIGYVAQTSMNNIDIPITVKEYFSLICSSKSKIEEVQELLGLNQMMNLDISSLSGGQKQRVSIGRALLHDISILFLDEPNSGLDSKSRKSLYELLYKLNKRGITIVIVSHYVDEISTQVNKVYEMDNNRVIESERDLIEYC